MATAKRNRSTAEETRERLITQAVEQFYKEGYLQISVERICASAEIPMTKGAFYHLFRSKEEILYLIHEHYVSHSLSVIAETEREKLDPRQKLSKLFENTSYIIKNMRKFVVVANREYRHLSGAYKRRAGKARRDYRCAVERIIEDGQTAGLFNPRLNPKVAALNYLGMINWIYQWIDLSGKLSIDQIMAMCEEQIMGGLEARPKAGAKPKLRIRRSTKTHSAVSGK